MSTPEQSVGMRAKDQVDRALFRTMFDDAAVFPPGLTPLPQAVADHVARQSMSYADLVGPLLLPAAAIEDFLRCGRPGPMEVALIGRPGTDLGVVGDARLRLEGEPGLKLTGIEIAWSPDWHRALGWSGTSLSVEVPRGSEQVRALSDIQRHADGARVRAKFRTGSTPDWSIPTPAELATFIRACVDHGLGFKLTGGLHHAISHTAPEGEDQFGFLNVIAATRSALTQGVEDPEMSSLLFQRDLVPVLDIITQMSQAETSAVRACFVGFGCCGVMDPIGDLASVGLIKETTV